MPDAEMKKFMHSIDNRLSAIESKLKGKRTGDIGKPITHNGEEYLTIHQAAQMINSSYNTVKVKYPTWGWEKYKIGQKVYFKKSDIRAWLNSKIIPVSEAS